MQPTKILVSKILLKYCDKRMQIQNVNPSIAASFLGAMGIKCGLILRSGRTKLLMSFTGVYSILVNTLSVNSIVKNQKMKTESFRKKDMQQIKATNASVRVSFSFIKFDGVVCSRICSICCSILFLGLPFFFNRYKVKFYFCRLQLALLPSMTHNVRVFAKAGIPLLMLAHS
jgi:hypothetical protein